MARFDVSKQASKQTSKQQKKWAVLVHINFQLVLSQQSLVMMLLCDCEEASARVHKSNEQHETCIKM